VPVLETSLTTVTALVISGIWIMFIPTMGILHNRSADSPERSCLHTRYIKECKQGPENKFVCRTQIGPRVARVEATR